MDSLDLFLFKCPPLDITQTLGPYFGDRVRRGSRFPGGLELTVMHGRSGFQLSIQSTLPAGDLVKVDWCARAWVYMNATLTEEEALGMSFDFVAQIPLEQVINLETNLPILCSEGLCVGMCNLIYLHLKEAKLSGRFADPDGPHTFRELLSSLRHLRITAPTLGRGYWDPLTNLLTRRAAIGNRISSLVLIFCPRMSSEDVESVKRAVDVFMR